MRLLLARHGEAANHVEDSLRPLTEKGREDVARIARILKRDKVRVKRLVHSGKLRAQETAEILAEAVAPKIEAEISEGLKPMASVDELALDLRNWTTDTLLVGHQPFMGALLAKLLTGNYGRDVVSVYPSCVSCLERIGEDRWALVWVLQADLG